MKVLLVNNDSDTWAELQELCQRCRWDVTSVPHGDLLGVSPLAYDLVVLSGGWWYDDATQLVKEYAAELQLISTARVPVLGICIGMQLMHVALNQAVPLLDEPQSGFRDIALTPAGQRLFGLPEVIRVFKNHTRGIIEAGPEFDVLAHSPGNVEIILHRRRRLLGVQFHPESEDDDGRAVQLMKTLAGALLEYRPGL